MNGIPSTCTPINPALSRYSIDAPSPVDFLGYRDAVKRKAAATRVLAKRMGGTRREGGCE